MIRTNTRPVSAIHTTDCKIYAETGWGQVLFWIVDSGSAIGWVCGCQNTSQEKPGFGLQFLSHGFPRKVEHRFFCHAPKQRWVDRRTQPFTLFRSIRTYSPLNSFPQVQGLHCCICPGFKVAPSR